MEERSKEKLKKICRTNSKIKKDREQEKPQPGVGTMAKIDDSVKRKFRNCDLKSPRMNRNSGLGDEVRIKMGQPPNSVVNYTMILMGAKNEDL